MLEKRNAIDWPDLVSRSREPLPMEPELWAAGCDHETAQFVARILAQRGYRLCKSPIDFFDADGSRHAIEYHQGGVEDFWHLPGKKVQS